MKNSPRGATSPIIFAIVVATVLVVAAFLYLNYPTTKNAERNFNDADLKLSYVRIPDEVNSVSIFNTAGSKTTTKADQDFIARYITSTTTKPYPPVAEAQKILNRYPDLIKALADSKNMDYQCSLDLGETCQFGTLRTIGNLAALKSFVQFQQKKTDEATVTAKDIVALGKKITAHNDNILSLLVGWIVQSRGYETLQEVRPKNSASFTVEERESLTTALRNEHKNVLRFMYTRQSEFIDYIVSSSSKPSVALDEESEEVVSIYRQAAEKMSWDGYATKGYFYTSYKMAVLNVDLACDAPVKDSKIDLKFDPEDKKTENYVGKTLYLTVYASLDTLNSKRCEVENLVNSL